MTPGLPEIFFYNRWANLRLLMDGGTYDAQAIIILIQAINHGVDHRLQIATLLSQQGIEPPELDGRAYNDAMS